MSLHVDSNGWLASDGGFPEIRFVPTVRKYSLDDGPLAHVWHSTDLPPSVRDEDLADRLRIQNPERPASFHALIGRNGTIQILAPFNVGTWHVGHPGLVAGVQVANVNRYTVGTELANAGRLQKVDGRFYVAGEAARGLRYEVPAADVVELDSRFYERFPDSQVAAAAEYVRALQAWKKWGREAFEYGHCSFDPARKSDPWPLFLTQILPVILDEAFALVDIL